MKTRTSLIISLVLAVLVLVAGLALKPQLPNPMAVHWGANGEANGYDGYFVGIGLIPIMMVGITLLLAAVPYIDPRKENYKKFIGIYNLFIIGFNIYMAVIQGITLAWNLGYKFNMSTAIIPIFGIFEILLGVVVQKAKSNYFVGIRTPWTLQDERVWDDTHRLGGKLFMAAGVVTLFGLVFPSLNIWLLLVPMFAVAIGAIVYSYFSYKKYNAKQ